MRRARSPTCGEACNARQDRTRFWYRAAMIHPAAPDLRRAYAVGPHGQIHYYDAGGAGTPLLMLHQSPASSSDWFSLLPLLRAAGIRAMAMDTPGMGLSDAFPDAPSIADYADAIPIVLDHAGVARADLLGHHTGVQIAVEAAVRHAGRVRSIALYGVPVMSAVERSSYWHRIVPNEKDGAVHRPMRDGTNLTDHFRRIETSFGPVAAQRMLLGALLAGPLWWHGHNAAFDYDIVPSLLAARQPILLISNPGEMLDENTRRAVGLRPDADFVSLDTSGPMAMDDDPEGLGRAVATFIARVAMSEGS